MKDLVSKKHYSYKIYTLPTKKNFIVTFYGWSHVKYGVYFLPVSTQKFLFLILLTSEGWKAESTLEIPGGFKHGAPGLGIQRLNH